MTQKTTEKNILLIYNFICGESPHGVAVSMLDCDIVENVSELQSPPYYVHFSTNTLGKGMSAFFFKLWVKYYRISTRMPLALNKP